MSKMAVSLTVILVVLLVLFSSFLQVCRRVCGGLKVG